MKDGLIAFGIGIMLLLFGGLFFFIYSSNQTTQLELAQMKNSSSSGLGGLLGLIGI